MILRWGYVLPEVRAALRPLLIQYLWLVPSWCRVLRVDYQLTSEEHDNAQAVTSASVEYRFGAITFLGPWLHANPTERRLTTIHELLHIPICPMTFEQNHAIARLFEDGESPKFRGTLEDGWRRAMESTVQDLAYAILLLPPESLPVVPFTEEEDP